MTPTDSDHPTSGPAAPQAGTDRGRTSPRLVGVLGLVGTAAVAGALLVTAPTAAEPPTAAPTPATSTPSAPAPAETTAPAPTGTAAPAPSTAAPTYPAAPTGTADTYAVPYGPADAAAVVTIYEDFACPYCAQLEQYAGEPLNALAESGQVRIEYRPIAILDYQFTDGYSTRAANAYASVLHVAGAEAAHKFRTLLFMNQPAEGGTGLSDDDLIEIAAMAGADTEVLDPMVRTGAFGDWTRKATRTASRDGINGTPTVFVNEQKVDNPFDGTLPDLIDQVTADGSR